MNNHTTTRYERIATPAPMRFQARDGAILQALHTYDGVLARRQIKDMFWKEASTKTMERRLTLLYHNAYLNMPSLDQRRVYPIPEPIVWLGWRGILHVANQLEVDIDDPLSSNENQLRMLEKKLRQLGIHWHREPRWSQLGHDIAVNDFRMMIEKAVSYWPSLELEQWIPESEFLSNMDVIRLKNRSKGVRPDGFFVLLDNMHLINNSPAKARFLLEFDNGTHPVTRFGRDKAIPGMAYIRSKAYRERFGFNSGRWLVVCKSELRMQHLKERTEKVLGSNASYFFFTYMDNISFKSVFSQPVWYCGGSKEPMQLIQNIGGLQ
jgi:hypothetical protein